MFAASSQSRIDALQRGTAATAEELSKEREEVAALKAALSAREETLRRSGAKKSELCAKVAALKV